MPTVPTSSRHRPRDNVLLFPACVAGLVSKNEMFKNEKAMRAMKTEWRRLWDKNVWDHAGIREWSDVAHEAQRKG
eukprot:3485270-Lingulodinium_polyedra.AAC.1